MKEFKINEKQLYDICFKLYCQGYRDGTIPPSQETKDMTMKELFKYADKNREFMEIYLKDL